MTGMTETGTSGKTAALRDREEGELWHLLSTGVEIVWT